MLCYSSENDILNLKEEDLAIVIPVNCVGVMGAGLAKQFADKYPELEKSYRQCCLDRSISIGHCVLEDSSHGKFIYFPTKDDWKNESKMEYIEAGLDSICRCLEAFPKLKLAFPPIGCGLGGLKIENVLPIIYEKTKKHRDHVMYLVGF